MPGIAAVTGRHMRGHGRMSAVAGAPDMGGDTLALVEDPDGALRDPDSERLLQEMVSDVEPKHVTQGRALSLCCVIRVIIFSDGIDKVTGQGRHRGNATLIAILLERGTTRAEKKRHMPGTHGIGEALTNLSGGLMPVEICSFFGGEYVCRAFIEREVVVLASRASATFGASVSVIGPPNRHKLATRRVGQPFATLRHAIG